MARLTSAEILKTGCFVPGNEGEVCLQVRKCKFASEDGEYVRGVCIWSVDQSKLPNNLGADDRKMEGGVPHSD